MSPAMDGLRPRRTGSDDAQRPQQRQQAAKIQEKESPDGTGSSGGGFGQTSLHYLAVEKWLHRPAAFCMAVLPFSEGKLAAEAVLPGIEARIRVGQRTAGRGRAWVRGNSCVVRDNDVGDVRRERDQPNSLGTR